MAVGINFASLRLRLSLWYVAFTFLCMSIYGAVLSHFLKQELRASREVTMRLREHRFVTFVDTEAAEHPGETLAQQIHHFSEASPDSDVIEIFDEQGVILYPMEGFAGPWYIPAGPFSSSSPQCKEPCLTAFTRQNHQWRLLTHRTFLAGKPIWLLMAGSIDEHYEILRSVRTGYFLLLPLVLIGSVAGGYAMSRRALLPVGRLTETARKLSLTSLDERLSIPQTGDELQSLAEAWNDLLVRLEAEVNRSTQFTLDVSHDLRSAVTVVLANAQLALRRPRTPEQYRASLMAIQQEATHILEMLEDLLLSARTAGAQQKIEKAPLCFNDIMSEVFETSKAAAAMKDQQLRLIGAGESDVQVTLEGNRSLLRRLASTLVDNALKYTPHGGEIVMSLGRSNGCFVFSVRDNGIGIPPHLQSRVFDRMFRADSARSRKETPGTGLGLSIAKWIADVHGFKIEVSSACGRGSVFSVLLLNQTIVF